MCSQVKAKAEIDKDGNPGESNESDSEEAVVDQETALAEKEKVRHNQVRVSGHGHENDCLLKCFHSFSGQYIF